MMCVCDRPFSGIDKVSDGDYPVPANTEEYLRSLYGYLGADARFNASTQLYDKLQVPLDERAGGGEAQAAVWTWLSQQLSSMGYK